MSAPGPKGTQRTRDDRDGRAASGQGPQLKRTLGVASLTFYGVGTILGAGIYSVLGVAAGRAGDALWLAFVGSALVALLTGLSYAELASTYPSAGAEFEFVRRAVPRWPALALVIGLLVALSGAATTATVSMAFAGYLRSFAELPVALVAWGLIAAVTALNVTGIRESGWANIVFTSVEGAGLVAFILLGATSESFGRALTAAPGTGVAPAAALVFFSFLGFEGIVTFAEEAKHPKRDVPRAILLSLAVATTLYVLVALAAVALIPTEALASAHAPLADAARTRSEAFAGALGGIALFATTNTALVSMLAASRLIFGMARAGELPRALATIQPKLRTPWAATLLVAVVSAALVPLGGIGEVASLSSFASLLAFAAVSLALIVLRRRQPPARDAFRVPGSIGWFPVLPALGVMTTLGVATQLEPAALLGGCLALAAFTGYAVWRTCR